MTTSLPSAQVGHTQLRVTIMGLGTGPLGKYRPISQEHASAVIHYALDNGIRFIDTAPFYGLGLSEEYLGVALAHVPRSSYVLATKVGRIITPEGKPQFDFSRDGILRSIEDSLKRLQLDYVDIFHIHDPDQYYHEALNTVTAIIVGAESANEVATNLQALHMPIPTELWTALKEEGLLHKDAPTPSQPIL